MHVRLESDDRRARAGVRADRSRSSRPGVFRTAGVLGTSGNVCSNATVKSQIKVAAQTAHDTIKSAEAQASSGATVDLTASTAAMTALQAILTSLPKSS